MEKAVSIIGLGYVGLPLLELCIDKGLEVYGADIDKEKISLIRQGISPINDQHLKESIWKISDKAKLTSNVEEAIRASSVVIVCVPTPIDDGNLPDLSPLKGACKAVSNGLQKGTLVVIESTIFPGTTEEIVLPLLRKAGLSEGEFFVAHCPERIDPGNARYTISNLPRVVAGINKESTKKAAEFYRTIIDAPVIELSSVKAAEATKIMENTFRDVNIAFINEMAKSFDKAGIDIMEVIKGASTKPFAFMPHYPGAGVGGHCIPVDPYYLIEKAKQIGFDHKFLSLAREINESMPAYTVNLLEEQLKKIGKVIENAKVGVLGVAYKGNVDDTRESPSLKVIEILKSKKAKLYIYDPFVKRHSNVKNLNELLDKADYVVLATDHREFRAIKPRVLKEKNIRIVIDGRNCLDKEGIKKAGIAYHGIGSS
jgi:UDP-N-acetyl-D-glucosamine dehydrogenase